MLVGKLLALTAHLSHSNHCLGGSKVRLSSGRRHTELHEQRFYRPSFHKRHSYLHEPKCIGLTPREACRILNGTDYTPICSLLALECKCRCKTALVINSPLPSWVLRQLDQYGFGAHCIQGVATSLGLLLLGRSQLSDRDLWTVTTHPTT